MNKPDASFLYSVLAASAIVGSFFSPFISMANGQTPTVNDNQTNINQNMSEPQLHIGVVTMPLACTSLDEVLGSVESVTSVGGNESRGTIMDRMQSMMSASDINATDDNMISALEPKTQQLKNMTEGLDLLCSLMTEEEMMEEINNTRDEG